ncbi:uncharacterized protein LOC134535001 [Bacillus rossius redtenbacheri]|uniref:uncharacterized protein LOC134535001 n=1 Tax=Bacillus rossius redtenbacheri TaxID=93214 RepID=UPI002FDDB989
MLSAPLCLGTGAVLVTAGGAAASYLTYLQLRHGASAHALLSTSDTLAVLATGVLFLATSPDGVDHPNSHRALEGCSSAKVVTVAALFLAPFVNAFVSILAQTYECYGTACEAREAGGSRRRLGTGLLAQWVVPAVATLALLFSNIHAGGPVARDAECSGSSVALLQTEVQHNCTRQQSDPVYALMSNVELPLKNNDDLIRQHVEEYNNTTVITELTNSIVSKIYNIVRESLNSSKQQDGREHYIPQFLHRHRRGEVMEESHNEYKSGTQEDSENTEYPTDSEPTESDTQYPVVAADKQEANTASTQHTTRKPTGNITYILLPDHIDVLVSFDELSTCVTECYLAGQFLKTHLFVVLFLCYFLPLAATGILYFLVRRRLAERAESNTRRTDREQPCASGDKGGGDEGNEVKREDDCGTRLATTADTLRQFILASVVLWTPSLVETLLRVWLCVSVPGAVSTLLFELAQLHGLARSALNVRLARADLKGGHTLGQGVLGRVTVHPAGDDDPASPSASGTGVFTRVKRAFTDNASAS